MGGTAGPGDHVHRVRLDPRRDRLVGPGPDEQRAEPVPVESRRTRRRRDGPPPAGSGLAGEQHLLAAGRADQADHAAGCVDGHRPGPVILPTSTARDNDDTSRTAIIPHVSNGTTSSSALLLTQLVAVSTITRPDRARSTTVWHAAHNDSRSVPQARINGDSDLPSATIRVQIDKPRSRETACSPVARAYQVSAPVGTGDAVRWRPRLPARIHLRARLVLRATTRVAFA